MRRQLTRLRVRYPETDRMGVVHHAQYLVWFEIGRTEWLREAGLSYAELEDRRGWSLPVIEVGARYRRPARYDDLLDVETVLDSFAGVRVRFAYRIMQADGESVLADGFSVHAITDRTGRPRRPAPFLTRLLAGGEAR